MSDHRPAVDLVRWLESDSHSPKSRPDTHCFRVYRDVALPGGETLTAVSIWHQIPLVPQLPELYFVELWHLQEDPVDEDSVGSMCGILAMFRAWYAAILEKEEFRGRRSRHRFNLHGNVIGRSVVPSRVIDLLSYHGNDVAFWTYRESEGRTEFSPHGALGTREPNSPLSRMLGHLAWEEPAEVITRKVPQLRPSRP